MAAEILKPVQRFFPEIQFSPPAPVRSPQLIPVEKSFSFDLDSTQTIVLEREVGSLEPVPEPDQKIPELGWTRRRLMTDYQDILGVISSRIGSTLPTANRYVDIVSQDKLIPQNSAEEKFLIARYGPYILRTIIGRCVRLPEGRFKLKLGFKGQEENTTEDEAIAVLGHEYGHSLGDHTVQTVFEEMKADAFEALFMSIYLDTDIYCLDGDSPDNLHDVARHRVGLLQAKGIREEEMIAHIIGANFGEFKPDDYLKRLGKSN